MKKIIAIIAILFITSTVMAAGTKEPTAPKTKTTKVAKVAKTSTKKDVAASKCQATTKAGTPCSRNATNGGKYCTQHAKMMKKG